MNEIRNQLQTLTGAAIEASQLSQVGGKVFTNAQDAQGDFLALTSWWMAIHAPTYGQPIPGSATTSSGSGDSPILAPVTNETALVVGLSLTNADLTTPAEVSVEIGGVIIAQVTVAPGASSVVIGAGAEAMPSLMLAEGHTLSQTVTGVAAGDVSFNVAYALVVQG
jgi:hypothetical protein